MRYQFLNLLKNFGEDRSGNVAMIFAMVVFPIIFLLGVTVDYGKGINRKQQLGYAMDVAALATAKADITIGKTELEKIANTYFYANLPDDIDPADVTISVQFLDDNKNEVSDLTQSTSVRITSNMDVETLFMRVGNGKMNVDGVPQLNLDLDSAASRDLSYIEAVMVLDNSGSMQFDPEGNQPAEGVYYDDSRMNILKKAAKKMVNILYENQKTSDYVRMGLLPFTRNVKLEDGAPSGTSGNYLCTNGNQQDHWLTGPHHGGSSCPDAEILPLTHKRNKVRKRINSMKSHGGTNSSGGLIWAFEMLKPGHVEFPGNTKPTIWDSNQAKKAIIFLTDGQNNELSFNTTTLQKCTEAKNNGILIYTLAFALDDTVANQMLQDCATQPAPGSSAQYFFEADDANSLNDAFKKIAQGLQALKLIN